MNPNIKILICQGQGYEKVCAMYFHRFLLLKEFFAVQIPDISSYPESDELLRLLTIYSPDINSNIILLSTAGSPN
jgi:cobalamin biosynthesis Co2+ chelatase CbiK